MKPIGAGDLVRCIEDDFSTGRQVTRVINASGDGWFCAQDPYLGERAQQELPLRPLRSSRRRQVAIKQKQLLGHLVLKAMEKCAAEDNGDVIYIYATGSYVRVDGRHRPLLLRSSGQR